MINAQSVVSINNVAFRYIEQSPMVFQDLELVLNKGDRLALLGPNGAGKSTLFSLLAQLNTPTDGSINGSWKRFSLVPQKLAYYPKLTIKENLQLFSQCCELEEIDKKAALEQAIELCLLGELLNKRASQCSGGEQRRLNLAIGLLNNPDFLILDEPTVGIDVQSRQWILDILKQLCDEGRTLIYTSHYFEEVKALCNRAVILNNGSFAWQGNLNEKSPDIFQTYMQVVSNES